MSKSIFLIPAIGIMFLAACKNNVPDEHQSHTPHDMPMPSEAGKETDSVLIGAKELDATMQSTTKIVISAQETEKPTIQEEAGSIKADGYITFDKRRNNKIASRIGGRIEKLYVKYNYQYVKKGEKILEVYSPELNTYQEEYLYLLKNENDKNLIKQSKEKLRLLGLSESQLLNLEKSGTSSFTITITSPYEGYVLLSNQKEGGENRIQNEASSSNMGSMGTMENTPVSSTTTISSNPEIREGMYVNKGQTLFQVNDFKQVWGIISVEAGFQSSIQQGAAVKVKSELLPEHIINCQIGFIEPFYEQGQKKLQARIYLPNEQLQLKLNSLINAEISMEKRKMLMVSSSSILDLGKRKIVWIKTGTTKNKNKIFEAKEVVLGQTSGNKVEIISGITEQDEIAADAAYLLDSESLIE